jgi:hypothetical protein
MQIHATHILQRGLQTVLIAFTTCALILSGCAPSLGKMLRVDDVPASSSSTFALAPGVTKIRIQKILDERPSTTYVTINDRKVTSDGDPGASVQGALEQSLKEIGYTVSLFQAPVTLTVSIKRWDSVITPNFPLTEITATAKLSVHVTLEGEKSPRYTGNYVGTLNTKHPAMTESKVSSVLGEAMQGALSEMLNDEKLLKTMMNSGDGALR